MSPALFASIAAVPPPSLASAFARLDAEPSVIFARQNEYVEAKVYEKRYPNLKARTHFPVNFSGGAANMGRTYRFMTRTGRAQFGLKFPRVGIQATERTVIPKEMSGSYGYSWLERLRVASAGMDLDAAEALSAKRAIAELENTTAYYGSEALNLPGAFSHPNFARRLLPFAISFASTPQQILETFRQLINPAPILSGGVERFDTVLMTVEAHEHLMTRPTSDLVPNVMIMDTLKAAYPGISFDWCNECKGAGTGGVDILFGYNRDEENMDLWIPHDFEILETVGPNAEYEYTTGVWQLFGGLIVRYAVGLKGELP